MKMKYILPTLGVAILILWVIFKPNQTNNRYSISIGYQEISLYRHIFVAQEKGFFEKEGLEVELKPIASANRMMEALIAGQLDVLGLTNLQVALTIEGKDPGKFKLANMLIWQEKSFPDYLLVRKDVKVKSVKELEGRTIGLHPGSAVKAFASEVLTQNNVDLNKTTFIELEPSIMQSAVVSKRVDALYCMDPVAASLLSSNQVYSLIKNPMKYIFPPPVPISGMALSSTFINEHPEEAKKVVIAIENAITYMRETGHEEEIAAIIEKYTPIKKSAALKMNISEYWLFNETDRNRIQLLSDKFFELKIAKDSIDINKIMLPKNFMTMN